MIDCSECGKPDRDGKLEERKTNTDYLPDNCERCNKETTGATMIYNHCFQCVMEYMEETGFHSWSSKTTT